jgi:hypothetical protein
MWGRAAIPRTVIADQPNPLALGEPDLRLIHQTRVRRAVVKQHRLAIRSAALQHLEHTAVPRRYPVLIPDPTTTHGHDPR